AVADTGFQTAAAGRNGRILLWMVLAVSPQGNRENGEIRMKTILLLLGFFILTACREPHEMPQTGGSNPTLLPEMSQRGDQNMQKQTIKISVQVPDSAWNLNIRE